MSAIGSWFGGLVASFQADRCADMAVGAPAAAPAEHRSDPTSSVQAAVPVVGRAARRPAALDILVDEGIGFSGDADGHLFAKHARIWKSIFGGARATLAVRSGAAKRMERG